MASSAAQSPAWLAGWAVLMPFPWNDEVAYGQALPPGTQRHGAPHLLRAILPSLITGAPSLLRNWGC